MIAKMVSQRQIRTFQKKILNWYEKNKRDLPWRVPYTTPFRQDPYKILVSEVMSQQTQLSRIVPKYHTWMKKFPTVQNLAKASTREVLQYWSGLGYNRRALYLREVARELVKRTKEQKLPNRKGAQEPNETKGTKVIWPVTEIELRKLPGIGEYTARALLCFAFGKQVAVVDTNVRRVIITQFQNSNLKSQMSNKQIREFAEKLLPKNKAYEWNQALMDYASMMLKDEKIPIPHQSQFKSSNRFYRGQVIQMLLKQEETIDSLFRKLENNGISIEKFEEVINQMRKEGFVSCEDNMLQLS